MTHICSRRRWLQFGSSMFGSMALSALANDARGASASALATRDAHHASRAKRVIFLFTNGGPSQMDMLDYKPELNRRDGEVARKKDSFLKGSPWRFAQHGQSGQWFSELLPHLARQSDRISVIRSMQTDSRAHPLAIPLLHTGSFQFTRPSMGSWIMYGLGTENQDLPGFITVHPTRVYGGPANYGSAFLPSSYQATRIDDLPTTDGPAERKHPLPNELLAGSQQLTQVLNQSLLNRGQAVPEVQGAIDSLGLSIRMQQTMPQVMNFSDEPQEVLDLYGVGQDGTDSFARQCLLARRCVEAGVRFVQLTHGGWDHHGNLPELPARCQETDQPMAALLVDLERRGMLEDTLVFWIGEFGRQPEAQILSGKIANGRDHNSEGFSAWMAGGGIRSGLAYGATDELGFEAVENKVHLYDLQATILHQLGLDHTRLTYRYSGRDFRLTDVHGRVVHDLIA